MDAENNSVVVILRWKPSGLNWRRQIGYTGGLGSGVGASCGLRSAYRCAFAVIAPLAGLLLFASSTADANVEGVSRAFLGASEAVPYIPSLDARFERLESFFRKYSCPEPQYVEEYLHIADNYGLDYRLLPAISIRETQCGVHEKGNNRLGFHPSTVGFSTVLGGIQFIGQRLGEHPYYKNKSLDAKLFKYNPLTAYPREVKWIMRQIEP